jgi:hypothetical protein
MPMLNANSILILLALYFAVTRALKRTIIDYVGLASYHFPAAATQRRRFFRIWWKVEWRRKKNLKGIHTYIRRAYILSTEQFVYKVKIYELSKKCTV